ncbi:MAG: sulfite exporter TauE/SafE family protein [Bacteroidales bacterium]
MFYFCGQIIIAMVETFLNYLHTAPLFSPGIIALLIGIGFFVGFINTIAGMATAISYAVFMAMGLPINVANGTTRLGVFAQFLVSSAIFKKKGYLDVKVGAHVGIPVGIGAFVGAELAAILRPQLIETIMGILLPIMAILLFVDTSKLGAKAKSTLGLTNSKQSNVENKIEQPCAKSFTWWKTIAFIIIGIYGGFTHAGVGLLIMFGSFFMLGLDMLRSNAIKQFAVVIYTPIALMIFIFHGQVNWPIALIYAIGNIAGGVAGSYASIKGGAKFIKASVALAIFVMSGWLLYKNL